MRLAVLALVTSFGMIVGAVGTVQAQPLGSFAWQMQPFCNRVTVAVTQNGPVFALDGFDDLCGAPQRAPLVGLATLNPDGTIAFGFHAVIPGGRPAHVDARISIATLAGAWQDSVGNSGSLVFSANTGGAPRPTPGPPGDVTAVTVSAGGGLTGGGSSGEVALGIADAGVTATKLGPNAISDSSKIHPSTIEMSDLRQVIIAGLSFGSDQMVLARSCTNREGTGAIYNDVQPGDLIIARSQVGSPFPNGIFTMPAVAQTAGRAPYTLCNGTSADIAFTPSVVLSRIPR